MKKICTFLLLALVLTLLCGAAMADSVGELPVFVAPEGVTITEHEAWNKERDGYSTRGWLLTGSDADTMGQAIETYANNLEDWGFIMTDEVEPKGLNACYWFFDVDETGYTTAELNGYEFEVFVYGEVSSDGTQVGLLIGYVSGIDFQEEQQWESLFGEAEPMWGSVFDETAEAAQEAEGYVIPSFASYAQEVLTPVDGTAEEAYRLSLSHVNVVNGYIELLESYGISGEDASEAEYGYPYCFWLEDCDEEIEPKKVETVHGSMWAYVFFATKAVDTGELQLSVQYADSLTPKDLGDRWTIEILSDSELESVSEFLAAYEAATGTSEEDTAEVADNQQIATNDGLVLLSPASFFDEKYTFFNVTNSDGYYYEWNWDTYRFRVAVDATEDEVEADAESYCQALVDSGYFKRVEETGRDLAYIGEQEVAIATSNGKVEDWQVNVSLSGGYSDIPYEIRVNLVEGFTFSDVAAPVAKEETAPAVAANDGSGSSCDECDGDGKCNKCGGSMWYWGYEWVYVNGSPVSQRVNKMCDAIYCNGGACSRCGGDGWR